LKKREILENRTFENINFSLLDGWRERRNLWRGVGEEVTTWKFCGVAAENSKTTAVNVMLCYFRTLNTIAEQTTRPLCVPVHDRQPGRFETENRLKKSFKKMLDKLTTIC